MLAATLYTLDAYLNTKDYSTAPCMKTQRALGIHPRDLPADATATERYAP